MTQESSSKQIPDYSFIRRYIGLAYSAFLAFLSPLLIIAILSLLLCLIFPPAFIGLIMMYAYWIGWLIQSGLPIALTIPLAALIVTFFGRDSRSIVISGIVTYIGFSIFSVVIIHWLSGYDGFPLAPILTVFISALGVVFYLDRSPQKMHERQLKKIELGKIKNSTKNENSF